jgi:hypothetical protein
MHYKKTGPGVNRGICGEHVTSKEVTVWESVVTCPKCLSLLTKGSRIVQSNSGSISFGKSFDSAIESTTQDYDPGISHRMHESFGETSHNSHDTGGGGDFGGGGSTDSWGSSDSISSDSGSSYDSGSSSND